MRSVYLQQETGRHLGGRGGQAGIIAALSLSLLFAAVGLAWDLGWDYFLKTRVQTAADSAAIAAAEYAANAGDVCSGMGNVISCGVSYTCAGVTTVTTSLQAGCLYATVDGPPVVTATMIENNGSTLPASLPNNKPTMWVQATVTASNTNFFLYWAGFHTASIMAQSVAGIRPLPAGSCIYVLSNTSPTWDQALTITGSSSITTSSCGASINSSRTDGLYMTGSAAITATGGGKVSINAGSASLGASVHITPAPVYNAGPVSDPFWGLTTPPVGTCSAATSTFSHSQTGSLPGGTYCGGISVTGAAQLTLTGGIYILNGGGLTVGNSGVVTATGPVMFYNTATGGHTAGAVSITGDGSVSFTAPSTGLYAGIAIFQDPALTNAATVANSGTGVIGGAYYFPKAAFSFTGNVGSVINSAFVANTITISGSSTLTADSTGTLTGVSRPSASLMQ